MRRYMRMKMKWFCSKVFLHNTGYVRWFVEHPTSPVLGKNVKEIKLEISFEFALDHGPQRDEKDGIMIYNSLSLNDDKRLNIVPAKSSTGKRINVKTPRP